MIETAPETGDVERVTMQHRLVRGDRESLTQRKGDSFSIAARKASCPG